MVDKKHLRQKLRNQRNQLTKGEVQTRSATIIARIMALDVYQHAQIVACYVSVGCEVDTRAFLDWALVAGKQIAVPVTLGEGCMVFQRLVDLTELQPAQLGLLEPRLDTKNVVSPQMLDLVFVPGVVFDRQGHRIGTGGGYYDRFLACTQAMRVGLAYDFQLIDAVPFDVHDVVMDIIVTEREVVWCRIQER